MPVHQSPQKEWAREHMRGLENAMLPSFKPGLRELDEEGIRHDVRQTIKHGFFSTMVALESALTLDEQKQLLSIVADEAKGKLMVTFDLLLDDVHQHLELVKHAEKVGCHSLLMGYPQTWRPTSVDEVERLTREFCEATSLGVTLYATERFDWRHLHPSSVPFEVFDRLVQIPNVVAMKVGFPEQGVVEECFRRYHDIVEVNIGSAGMLATFPVLKRKYHVQWGGAGTWEFWQSPEKPYVVEYFNLVLEDKIEQAMKVYWEMAPANQAALAQLGGKHRVGDVDLGVNPWPLAKFAQWSVGGNGGLVRQPTTKLTREMMDQRRAAYRSIGIQPAENLDEFWVGRAEYARRQASGQRNGTAAEATSGTKVAA